MHSVSLQTYYQQTRSGLSQRAYAKRAGLCFNTLHSRIEYAKTQLRRASDMPIQHQEIIERKTIYGHGEIVNVPDNERRSSVDRGAGYYPGRAAIFDIESATLHAQTGVSILACACILTLDTNQLYTYNLQYTDNHDDTRVLSEVLSALRGYDILIGHYINGHDVGFLRTRAIRAQLPPLPAWHTIDTYTLAQRTVKSAQRKSQAMLMDLLGIEWEKTAVMPNKWNEIQVGNEEQFEDTILKVIQHCQLDALGARGLVYRLFPSAILLGGLPISYNQ